VAAVAIDSAQIKGVLPLPLAQLRASLPALGNPTNLHKAVALTQKEFRFGFGNAVSEEEYRDSAAVTELKQFEGRSHSLTIDVGWRKVADAVLIG
jgi:hypothetical protein